MFLLPFSLFWSNIAELRNKKNDKIVIIIYTRENECLSADLIVFGENIWLVWRGGASTAMNCGKCLVEGVWPMSTRDTILISSVRSRSRSSNGKTRLCWRALYERRG